MVKFLFISGACIFVMVPVLGLQWWCADSLGGGCVGVVCGVYKFM